MIFSLNRRIKSLYLRLNPQSASSRSVLKLAGGTAGGQLIFILASPILTRLYNPESFGILATFTAILALINALSSLRYELAITVPEDVGEAKDLVWLCVVLVAISTVLTALGVALLENQQVVFINEPALTPLLWLLPIGVLLSGLYQPITYWAIRRKQFGLLAKTKISQSIFGVTTNLGLAPWGPIGLILGEIVRQSAGSIKIFQNSKEELLPPVVTPRSLGKVLRRYSHFGIYSSPAGLINIVGNQLPIIILSSTFGAQLVGQLALAQRVLLVPAGLIGVSVSKVFLAKAPESFRQGTLTSLVDHASRKLFLWSFVTAIPIAIAGPLLVPLFFGEAWSIAGMIILIFLPVYILQLSVSSVSTAFIAIEQNKSELIAQVCQAGLRVFPLLISVMCGLEFLQSLIIFSIASSGGYLFYWILLKRSLLAKAA